MSAVDGERLVRVLHQVAVTIEENKDHLCRLDSDVGDGDHGVSMTIGMRAARRNLDDLQRPTPEAAFRAVAEAFADEVGAAIGPIYEEAFGAAADAVAGTSEIADADGWARVLEAMAAATQRVGGAAPGDKTLVDAWVPAAEAARSGAAAGKPPVACLEDAARAAQDAVEATKGLVPRVGRASRLGERARGFQDAGATSAALIVKTIAEAVAAG